MISSNTAWMNLNCIDGYGLLKNAVLLAAIYYMQLHVLFSALYLENGVRLSVSRHNCIRMHTWDTVCISGYQIT